MNKIIYKDLTISHICRKSLKNSYITIDKDSNILLKTSTVSKTYIESLLSKKENWIREQLLKIEQNQPLHVNLEDEVLLFAELYSVDASEATQLRGLLSRLRKPSLKNVLRCYDDYYKIYSQEYLPLRVEYFAQIMNLDYKEIKFKKMRARWGSCSSQRVITFNTQLIKLKKEQIDYVVVHELAHLVYMNHSRKFHDLVQSYIPNAKNIRKEIKTIIF
ncbi:MAG: SprT family zinc-dependent metalloprotease [Campylobacterota bacterium]|nr:SprT family zinc-dependent metalloprotease [Campylobacterota bacterium]